jgi:hypothetical protein
MSFGITWAAMLSLLVVVGRSRSQSRVVAAGR